MTKKINKSLKGKKRSTKKKSLEKQIQELSLKLEELIKKIDKLPTYTTSTITVAPITTPQFIPYYQIIPS